MHVHVSGFCDFLLADEIQIQPGMFHVKRKSRTKKDNGLATAGRHCPW